MKIEKVTVTLPRIVSKIQGRKFSQLVQLTCGDGLQEVSLKPKSRQGRERSRRQILQGGDLVPAQVQLLQQPQGPQGREGFQMVGSHLQLFQFSQSKEDLIWENFNRVLAKKNLL